MDDSSLQERRRLAFQSWQEYLRFEDDILDLSYQVNLNSEVGLAIYSSRTQELILKLGSMVERIFNQIYEFNLPKNFKKDKAKSINEVIDFYMLEPCVAAIPYYISLVNKYYPFQYKNADNMNLRVIYNKVKHGSVDDGKYGTVEAVLNYIAELYLLNLTLGLGYPNSFSEYRKDSYDDKELMTAIQNSMYSGQDVYFKNVREVGGFVQIQSDPTNKLFRTPQMKFQMIFDQSSYVKSQALLWYQKVDGEIILIPKNRKLIQKSPNGGSLTNADAT
ncbi:MAG: hypothetical protein LBI43_02095 [Streptococcaceae bacterium]|jgi:hypothetical protein|nr:hypothetical protein [Streptococcaceae bacterium]